MSKKNHLYVDIHVLQTVPPSCVNRDDTGSPKTAIYGGVRRARVSSQAWKRAVRLAFREMYKPEQLAKRTQRVVHMVQTQIELLDASIDAQKAAERVLEAAKLDIKFIKKLSETGVEALFFMSEAQAKNLARIAIDMPSDPKELETVCIQALRDNPSVDQILFGRMVAGQENLKYDATAQVAHAISTHSVQNEYDYFTAVDDLVDEGAGHVNTAEFNSSTLYRYATVNAGKLANWLEKATPEAVRNFIEAFVYSMPTGKQNTFANRTLPEMVYVTIRRDQPVNLVGAFEQPIQSDRQGGYVKASVQRLQAYAQKVYSDFIDSPDRSWIAGGNIENAEALPLSKLLEAVESFLGEEQNKG